MDVTLIARLCYLSAYDAGNLARHVNRKNDDGLVIRDFSEEMSRIARDRAGGIPVHSFRIHNLDWLDSLEKRYGHVAFNIYISDIASFGTLVGLFRSRFDSLKTIFIVGSPFHFYDEYCSFTNTDRQLAWYRQSFFERELYRIDKLLALAEKILAPERIFIAASNNHRENERQVLEFLGLSPDDMPEELPLPVTLRGRLANRLFYSNPLQANLSLEEWRAALCASEKNGVPERLLTDDDILRLDGLVGKYWRFARKRYPMLENVMDVTAEDMLRLLRKEISQPDWQEVAAHLPVGKYSKILATNPLLRRGLPTWQREFFTPSGIDKTKALPKCCILTFAFNQEKYIGECIESVAAQKLDCDLEHIIIDDASTDGTQEIIRVYADKYPHIKPVLFKSKPANLVPTAFNLCKSQYVALCDGDDYFTDDRKLQKQIDFLDGNPDFALCFHFTEVFYEDGRPSHVYPPQSILKKDGIYTLDDILQGNPMQTSSVMYRWRFVGGVPAWFKGFLVPGDWYWHLLHVEKGKVAFLPEVMSRYRRHPNAGYASADGDTVTHRLKKGMLELEAYQICDEHFKGARHKDFQTLADGVFTSYLRHYSQSNDSSFLDKAAAVFPEFFRSFLEDLEKAGNKK